MKKRAKLAFLNAMAVSATLITLRRIFLLVDERPLRNQRLVQRPGPFGWAKFRDQVFQLVQAMEIGRIVFDVIDSQQARAILDRMKHCKHADDFSQIASQAQNCVAID